MLHMEAFSVHQKKSPGTVCCVLPGIVLRRGSTASRLRNDILRDNSSIQGGNMAKHWKWGFVILAAVWAALFGNMLGYAWNVTHQEEPIPEVPMEQIQNTNISEVAQETMDRFWTVAVFGVDSREGKLGKGTRSDMEMVLNINLETGEIRMVSVYRDTYVKIDEKNKYDKINQAYFEGGPAQAIWALSENMDLNIDDYVSFSWKAVADAINLLGGIDVEISPEEFKVINGFITETVESTGVGSHHLKKPGMNHLDGVQAVAYARLRKMDTDFMRTKRQRLVAELVLEKLKQADLGTVRQLAFSILPSVSSSVGMKDILSLAGTVSKFHLTETEGFPFELKDALVGKKDCVIPVTLRDNVIRLHQFLFDEEDYVPSKQVEEISEQIELHTRKR